MLVMWTLGQSSPSSPAPEGLFLSVAPEGLFLSVALEGLFLSVAPEGLFLTVAPEGISPLRESSCSSWIHTCSALSSLIWRLWLGAPSLRLVKHGMYRGMPRWWVYVSLFVKYLTSFFAEMTCVRSSHFVGFIFQSLCYDVIFTRDCFNSWLTDYVMQRRVRDFKESMLLWLTPSCSLLVKLCIFMRNILYGLKYFPEEAAIDVLLSNCSPMVKHLSRAYVAMLLFLLHTARRSFSN